VHSFNTVGSSTLLLLVDHHIFECSHDRHVTAWHDATPVVRCGATAAASVDTINSAPTSCWPPSKAGMLCKLLPLLHRTVPLINMSCCLVPCVCCCCVGAALASSHQPRCYSACLCHHQSPAVQPHMYIMPQSAFSSVLQGLYHIAQKHHATPEQLSLSNSDSE